MGTFETEERLYICYFYPFVSWKGFFYLSKRYDLINKRFGKLTVVEKLGTRTNNSGKSCIMWKCICDCGNDVIASTSNLNNGHTKQCTNCGHIETGLKRRENLIGKKFGKLTVTKMLYNYNNTSRTRCLCNCDCGKKDILRDPYELKQTIDSSCGCGRKEYIRKFCGKDIDGQRFGRLIVTETLWNESPPKVKCTCDCGNIVILRKSDVQSGHTLSCGCLQTEMTSLRNQVDHTGQVSNYGVKLLSQAEKNNKGQWLWNCECGYCHKIFKELPARVLNNHVRSCGCLISSSREKFIENILIENNIEYIPQYTFLNCKSKNNYVLRFDFGIIKNGKLFYLIEYDGEQHFHPVKHWGGEKGYINNLERDEIKNKYCKENNIKLLRLPYTLTENEIKDKITNIIYP